MHVMTSFMGVGMSLHCQCAVFYVDDVPGPETQVRVPVMNFAV